MKEMTLVEKIRHLEAEIKRTPGGYVKNAMKADLRMLRVEQALGRGETKEQAYLKAS